MPQISLLMMGWCDEKRNDDIAAKIWIRDWAREPDWDASDERGKKERVRLKGVASLYLSI